MRKPRAKARTAPVIQIGGTNGEHTKAVLVVLEKVALRATENGREAVAIEAVRALGALGNVNGATITGCVFGG